MRNKSTQPFRLRFLTSKTFWTIAITVIVVLVIVFSTARIFTAESNHVSVETSTGKIEITPIQIKSIENIGEWEFLSIENEEIVDTTRYGFFGDDHLVRVYYGTLRLGVNMHEVQPEWIRTDGDTLVAVLPPVKLLDNDFIDEAKTTSFYENGKWSNNDREKLYQKAYDKMKKRCLVAENYRLARQNARHQMGNLFRSMGFEFVKIEFSSPGQQKKR